MGLEICSVPFLDCVLFLFFRGFDFGGKDRCWNDTVDAVDAVVTVDTA